MNIKKHKTVLISVSLILLPIIIFIISLSIGKYPVSINSLISSLYAQITEQEMSAPQLALIRVRLPRTILAMIIGASLSLSGAVYQGLFKNPVVSPDLLGASSGASVGAVIGILIGASASIIQLSAFICGIMAVLLVGLMNKIVSKQANSMVNLILCGMLVSSLCNALVSFAKFVADTDTKLPAITFWLMGSLSAVTLKDLKIFWIFLPICIILVIVRWKVNILSLGDDEAHMLGVNVQFYRWLIIICATLLSSMSVSVCGNIGWVGLIVPHLSRMIVGSNYGKLIPTSIAIGASFMLVVDTFSRMLLTVEIPLGILTAIIGAPFFFILILRSRKGFV